MPSIERNNHHENENNASGNENNVNDASNDNDPDVHAVRFEPEDAEVDIPTFELPPQKKKRTRRDNRSHAEKDLQKAARTARNRSGSGRSKSFLLKAWSNGVARILQAM